MGKARHIFIKIISTLGLLGILRKFKYKIFGIKPFSFDEQLKEVGLENVYETEDYITAYTKHTFRYKYDFFSDMSFNYGFKLSNFSSDYNHPRYVLDNNSQNMLMIRRQ